MTGSISEWKAAGCDYNQGVELYASLPGHKPVLLKNFRKGETPALILKLKYELSQFNEPAKFKPAVPEPKPKPESKKKLQDPVQIPESNQVKKSPLFHQLPVELRDVLLEAHELFRKNCFLKAALNDLEVHQEDEALQLQLQIFDNTQGNAECWQKIDYWLNHKQVLQPVPSKVHKLNPDQLWRRQQQLYSSKSKLEKRLNKNKQLLKETDSVRLATKLKKAIAKQEFNLVKQTTELNEVTNRYNGTNE